METLELDGELIVQSRVSSCARLYLKAVSTVSSKDAACSQGCLVVDTSERVIEGVKQEENVAIISVAWNSTMSRTFW